MKKLVLLIVFFHFARIVSAQLGIAAGGAAATVVSSLVDPILNPSNATITCPAANYGLFTALGAPLTKVGSSSGVILSTGKVTDASKNPSTQATTPAFALAVCTGGTSVTDTELDVLVGGAGTTFYDRCMLEFDILPQADTLKVTYVFGSEEYYGFCAPGSSFNDLFGFFVKKNPSGAYTNFAWVPGTNPPQSVNVTNIYPVNCGTPAKNPAYFVDNTAVNTTGVVYNGLTTSLNATIPIQRGVSYHVKIAIADKGDACLDAALFIKTFSFAIPVDLLSFTALTKGPTNLLRWHTATEKNNDRFEVLRSADGQNFETIGALKGAGNSSVLRSYEFRDEARPEGTLYYRLRQVDFDGKASYSAIKTITTRLSIEATPVYPNPATGPTVNARLEVPSEGTITSLVTDLAGKIVQQQEHQVFQGANEVEIPVESLPKGYYYLRFTGPGYESNVLKMAR
jgi:hypothetical protein